VSLLHRNPPSQSERVNGLSDRLQHVALHAGEPRSIAASALMVAAVRILCEDFDHGRAATMLKRGIDEGVAAFRKRAH
jgi:hypothetical protein